MSERAERPSPRKPIRRAPLRDQTPTAFASVLLAFLRRTPGCRGAALVDPDGETVDYAGSLEPFEVKVAAAHARILFEDLVRSKTLHHPQQLTIRAAMNTLAIRHIFGGYCLVALMARQTFLISKRSLSVVECELSLEAKWPSRHLQAPRWCVVDVEASQRPPGRPLRILVGPEWHPLDILGTVVGVPLGERGFRVRIATGIEATLIREMSGTWYSEERLIPAPRTVTAKFPAPLLNAPGILVPEAPRIPADLAPRSPVTILRRPREGS